MAADAQFIKGTVDTTATPERLKETFTVAASTVYAVTFIMGGIYCGYGYILKCESNHKPYDDNKHEFRSYLHRIISPPPISQKYSKFLIN